MSASRFTAQTNPHGAVVLTDAEREGPVTFFGPLGQTGNPEPGRGAFALDRAQAWAVVLNEAVDDLPAACFSLRELTGWGTNVTREVLAEVLDGHEHVLLPVDGN